MDIRKSGVWLLAILGITVTLALGCEKGALGVKVSTVTGRLLNKNTPGIPVVGARVTLISQSAAAGQAELAIGQNPVSVTDTRGVFVFENVGPDKLILEATAVGYEDFRYPNASAPVPNFYLGNNTFKDLGDLLMKPLPGAPAATLTEYINVSGIITNSFTGQELGAAATFSLLFDGKREPAGGSAVYGIFRNQGYVLTRKLTNYTLDIIVPGYQAYNNATDTANLVRGDTNNFLNISLVPNLGPTGNIKVQGQIFDAVTRTELPGSTNLSFLFNGEKPGGKDYTYSEFVTNGFTLPAASAAYIMQVVAAGYVPYTSGASDPANLVSGTKGNTSIKIYLTPNPLPTYNLLVRCTNVPDYISGGVVNLYAEKDTGFASPPFVLASQTINDLGDLTQPNLPAVIPVPGIAFPIVLRVNIRGYQDELVRISQPRGITGDIRVDVNFLSSNGSTLVVYDQNTASQAQMLDNRNLRRVTLRVSGPNLFPLDTVIATMIASGPVTYDNLEPAFIDPIPPGPTDNVVGNRRVMDCIFNAPVGYKQGWTVTVIPSNPASNSFTLTSGVNPLMISPPNNSPDPGQIEAVPVP